MATFAEAAALRDQQWCIIVTVEGSGTSSNTLYKYCTRVPAYAAGNSAYRPWIAEWPEISGEKIDPLGGLPESGELEIQLLDYQDTLTDEWRIEADPTTKLNTALSASATSLSLSNDAGIAVGSRIYIGNEVIEVTSGASSPWTVARGRLDTTAFAQNADAPAWTRLHYILQRRMRLYLAPYDGNSASDEVQFGEYQIDNFDLDDENPGIFVLRSKSAQKFLERIVPRRKAVRAYVAQDPVGDSIHLRANGAITYWSGSNLAYWKAGDEVILIDGSTRSIVRRGQLGTTPNATEIKRGLWLDLVFGADHDPGGLFSTHATFFRWSPGPSPSSSRASGTWNKSAHWVDIILNILVSSADASDGLELANRNTTYGAWDCLPVGCGLGIPHTLIDWSSFLAVRQETPEEVFPEFSLGTEPKPFGALIAETFLKPLGAYITTSGGLVRLLRTRAPIASGSTASIGVDDVLWRKTGEGVSIPDVRVRLDPRTVRSIVLKLNNGAVTVNNEDLADVFGRSYYGTDGQPLELTAPGSVDSSGVAAMLNAAALRKLARGRRPNWIVEFKTDLSRYGIDVASLIDFTHSDLPNLATGVRGWSAVLLEIQERRLVVQPKNARLEFIAIAFLNIRTGRIPPSARIASVANAAGSPQITVTQNRYTQSDTLPVNGYTTTDAAAFATNDIVRIRTRNSTEASAVTTSVASVAGNVITIASNPGSVLSNGVGNAGQIIEYAGRANAVAQQYNTYVFLADKTNRNVGLSAQVPWQYGDS